MVEPYLTSIGILASQTDPIDIFFAKILFDLSLFDVIFNPSLKYELTKFSCYLFYSIIL